MKFTPSIMFAKLSGSSGAVTASSSRGQGYVRTRVIPANPNTDGQKLQRNALARIVTAFQSLTSPIKTFLDVLGADQSLSGFNILTKSNIALEKYDGTHPIVPANRYADTLQSFVLDGGANPGEIDVTWAQGAWLDTDNIIIAHKLVTAAEQWELDLLVPGAAFRADLPWLFADTDAIHMDDEAFTITGLTASTKYAVVAIPVTADGLVMGGGACGIHESAAI